MKQQCNISFIWFTWVAVPILVLFFGIFYGWLPALIVAVISIVAQLVYLRIFPNISRFVGYGSVKDKPANESMLNQQVSKVKFYTASVCPFCPIVRNRLKELQKIMKFEIVEIDVTFRPSLVREKGLLSVPVLEVNDRLLFGISTSETIVQFLLGEPLSKK